MVTIVALTACFCGITALYGIGERDAVFGLKVGAITTAIGGIVGLLFI